MKFMVRPLHAIRITNRRVYLSARGTHRIALFGAVRRLVRETDAWVVSNKQQRPLKYYSQEGIVSPTEQAFNYSRES
jgi:hypothetical protein